KIDIQLFFEFLDFPFRRNLVDHCFQLVVLKWRIIDADQIAIDAQHRRVVGRKMKVGGLLLRHQLEKGVNASHGRRSLLKLNRCHEGRIRGDRSYSVALEVSGSAAGPPRAWSSLVRATFRGCKV